MTTLIAMRGLPASGKTTRARQFAQAHGAVVVGRDFIREQMFGSAYSGGKPKPASEEQVTVAENAQVRALLKSGTSVIVDNTHIKPRYLKAWAKIAAECGAYFHVEDVRTEVEECIHRDRVRYLAGGRFVGSEVINRMAKQIDWSLVREVEPIVVERYVNWDHLPSAILVDIDGTLAHMTGRSPYDYSRVSEDKADPVVRNLVYMAGRHCRVIIMSGRDDTCRPETVQWLADNFIHYNDLLMRPTDERGRNSNGQKLPDWIVKYNLFNEHIRNQYNIEFVLDDRNQVVEMWRALGLKCLQVQPGDF